MQKKTNGSKTLGILGASIAGLAATAYFFFSSKAKVHQRHAKAWAIKMKGDVIEKLEKGREVTESVYREIIDSVAKEYAREKKASEPEINMLAEDLKKHWKALSKLAKGAKQEMTKGVARVAKKVRLR